jgi:putative transposase
MPQSHSQVWLHIVFSTKNRNAYLEEAEFRDQMFRMLAHHVKQVGCVVAIVGGRVDHVHLLVGLSRTLKICKLIEVVKSETSKWAKDVVGGNRGFLRGNPVTAYSLLAIPTWAKWSVTLTIKNC